MKRSPLLPYKKLSLPLAFLLPMGGMLLLRLVSSLTFSGMYSMLYSDCYHQYYPFFLEFRRALLRGESLLFSWNVGMGMDYLGLIAYYLASPLNLLSVLLPESWMLGYFSLLMPVKLGFAGLFFAIFLKKVFCRSDLSIALFGCFYAYCAWALAYQWNIMWLDTFALLPLVVLGTVSLLRDKKFVLYTLTLFLSVCANYYIGLFTCIFVFLIFFCYEICRWSGWKKFLLDLLRIGIFSVLAIGMTAVLELPALAALQATQSGVNKFPTGFRLNIAEENTFLGLLDAMRQVAGNRNGGLEPSFKEGLPNLYCGVGVNILAFLFLLSKQVKLRDKLCCVFLLLFFNVSFIIRQLDYIWHGFHFTNMIPYRFSFLHSFVLLYMAYRAWLLRRSFRPWQLITAGFLCVGLLLCSEGLTEFTDLLRGQVALSPWIGQDNILRNLEIITTRCVFIAYNTLFLLVYFITLAHGMRPKLPRRHIRAKRDWLETVRYKRRVSGTVLMVIFAVELAMMLVNFGSWYPGTNVVNYPKGTKDAAKVVAYMRDRENDTLFYRAETTHSQSLNDGALNGYNGISTFTSSANVKVTEFMRALGYGAKNTYNRYCFEESSPIANLFLNLKYMIARDGEPAPNAYFQDVYSSGNIHLLENNAYLPLGFLANAQLINVDFYGSGNKFLFQNELLTAATGINEPFWQLQVGGCLTIRGSDLTLGSKTETGYCSYTTENKEGKITYRYTPSDTGLLCFFVDQTQRNNLSVYVNGSEKALYTESYSLPQMLSVCDVAPGDVVEIRFSCAVGKSGTISVSAAVLNEEAFRRAYDVLAASPLELTRFETTLVEGTIRCDRDGVLYTSIPQDGNWQLSVDGKPAQTVAIGGAMCGVILSEGYHTVRFTYENRAFSIGWKVSLLCLMLFLAAWWVFYQPKLSARKGYKGKYLK